MDYVFVLGSKNYFWMIFDPFKILGQIRANGKLLHHHDNGNVLNRTSMDIDLFNKVLPDEI